MSEKDFDLLQTLYLPDQISFDEIVSIFRITDYNKEREKGTWVADNKI